jgi:quinol monooxygenase YgiN
MVMVSVLHEVKDYDEWKVGFDGHDAARRANGCTGYRVLRSENNPNNVLVVTEWPAAANAHAFAEDPALPEVMEKAGIIGAPRIEFYELAEAGK